ncbi:MAG: glycine cleavage system protein GcvH [Candidatus Bathyarchaeia archaeon]|nr:glycine cleavage system protein GcvH [Candidatus Bathyarchaeota archaeon]
MDVEGYEIREGLYYSKDHEWVRVEGDACRVGISDYAQKTLHEVVFAELPEKGRKISRAETLGTLESVKAVAEVYAPVSGEVVDVNEALREAPELVNKSPYDEGWIAVISPSNLKEELEDLMDAERYGEYIKEILSK